MTDSAELARTVSRPLFSLVDRVGFNGGGLEFLFFLTYNPDVGLR